MNSNTGDFSDIRKTSEELYNRGAYSSVKIKPRKIINLRPLNLNCIKKEIEESTEEDYKQTIPFKINENEVEKKREDIIEVLVDNVKLQHMPQNDNRLKEITNCSNTTSANSLSATSDKLLVEKPKNLFCPSSNVNGISQMKENKFILQEQKNDSFDLDFSVLSLSTPVKEGNSNKVNSSGIIKSEHVFVTPKDLSKYQCVRRFLETPRNPLSNISAKKITPSTSIFGHKSTLAQKISPTIPEEESVLKNDDKGSNTFPNYLKENISTPSHKVSIKLTQDIFSNKKEENLSVPKNTLKDNSFKTIKVNCTEYIIFNLIGRGGSSEVYQCYNIENRLHVAIKCVSLDNSASADGYINEVKLLEQLQTCDKIIKMFDYEISDSQRKLLVVLENGGKDLSTILKQLAGQKSHIPMYMLLFYWMEMLYAVNQIHSRNIIHSDLKPANFLKVDEGLKLIDFGIASSVQTEMTSVIKTKQEGSCNYISPEALNSDSPGNFNSQNPNTENYKIHYKSDVWSLGCILYQFVYRRTPFQHIKQLWPKLAAIMNPDHKIEFPEVDWVSPKIISTIKKCLQYNVKSRPSVDELIAEYDGILHNI